MGKLTHSISLDCGIMQQSSRRVLVETHSELLLQASHQWWVFPQKREELPFSLFLPPLQNI